MPRQFLAVLAGEKRKPFAAGSGGPATLTAYEESAENGRPINVVPIPVVVR